MAMPAVSTFTPVILLLFSSSIADFDLRDEWEYDRPRDACRDIDADPDLANDVALDRERIGLLVDGAGRSSGMSWLGANFERSLLDLRIEEWF